MGYALRCAVAKAESPEEAARLHDRIAGYFCHCSTRVFHEPFLGVITGLEWRKVLERFEQHPEAFDYANEEEARDDIAYGLEEQLAAFSRRTPDRSWAYIDVDCFGGTCLYDGFIARDGEHRYSLAAASQRGHLELLEHLGVTGLNSDFEPFHGGFLTGGSVRIREPGREIDSVVQGRLRGLPLETLRLRLPLSLPYPWKASSKGARTLMLESQMQDLSLSINAESSDLRIAGHCHLPPEMAKGLIDDLVAALEDSGCVVALSLLTLDRVLLHHWERGLT
jgi:hypothetical protein